MSIFTFNEVGVIKGKQKILEDISLRIEDGEIVTIIGPSGSGKSTLLRLLNLLSSPTLGTILYKDKELQDYDILSLRREISYVFQKPYLFGDKVIENLIYPFEIGKTPIDHEKIDTLIKRMNLSRDILDKKNNELSGGEQQRICLIRSLLTNPRVLLLDEVTASLDPINSKIVEEFILESYQQDRITLLVVTHNIAQAERLGKKTLYLKDGRVKYYEDTKRLFNNISDEELNRFKLGER